MTKWLLSIILSLAVAGGMYSINESYKRYLALEGHQEFLQRKLRDSQQQQNQLVQEARKIAMWNNLWESVKAARLEPEHWFINPINTSRTFSWQELEQLVAFLSNGDPAYTGYWFKPEQMVVTRTGAESGPRGDGPATQSNDRFSCRVKGQFLIPRLGGL